MITAAALHDVATLYSDRLRLEPQDIRHFDGLWGSLANRDNMRLTGTHATFSRDAIRGYLDRLPGRHDRADWAIIRAADERYLGEIVLNELDADNESMNLRIALSSQHGQGYGTEAIQAVVAYGFEAVGLHRISLEVYAFNPRALRTYEKCRFVREGVARDALLWDGQRIDAITMSILATDNREDRR